MMKIWEFFRVWNRNQKHRPWRQSLFRS